jgi:DinB family protein
MTTDTHSRPPLFRNGERVDGPHGGLKLETRRRDARAGSRDDQSLAESLGLGRLLPVINATHQPEVNQMSHRSDALADRLEQGARALAKFASALSDTEWHSPVPRDGRKVGVVVHHVATMYPLEIQLALTLAGGQPITGVTWDTVHEINARHATEYDGVTKEAALDLLQRNSVAAAAAIRALSDGQLDQAAPVSLNGDAPLTCQFMLEDHAVRHSYHHLGILRRTVKRRLSAARAS